MTKAEEMKIIMDELQKLHEGLKRQNEMLVKTVRYYATTPWKEISMTDRGECAKTAMIKVWGDDYGKAI